MTIEPRLAGRLLATAAVLGLAFDVLFHRRAVGVSAPLWVAAALVALFWAWRAGGARPTRGAVALGVLIACCALSLAVRASPMLGVLNVAAIGISLALAAYSGCVGGWARLPVWAYGLFGVKAALFAGILPAMTLTAVDVSAVARRSSRAGPYARGLILAVPIVAVFLVLMASADLVFNDYLVRLVRLDWWEFAFRQVGRGVRAAVYAWFIGGLLTLAVRRALQGAAAADRDAADLAVVDRAILPATRFLGATEAAVVVGCVDALFAVFIAVQFAYLFGGERNIHVAGFTYAQYARHGFFELLYVAALALALVLSLKPFAEARATRARTTFRVLASALGGGVLVVLASAAQRIVLYERAYGLTELRLLSHTFMIALALVGIWLIVTLWRWRDRFAAGAALVAAGWLIGLNILNPDAFIVRRNLAMWPETGILDMAYLVRLSDDALPALLAARPALPPAVAARVEVVAAGRATRSALPRYRSWPSWHLARWRVARLVGP